MPILSIPLLVALAFFVGSFGDAMKMKDIPAGVHLAQSDESSDDFYANFNNSYYNESGYGGSVPGNVPPPRPSEAVQPSGEREVRAPLQSPLEVGSFPSTLPPAQTLPNTNNWSSIFQTNNTETGNDWRQNPGRALHPRKQATSCGRG